MFPIKFEKMEKKGWHSRAGRKYYCVKKGKLAKGWKRIEKTSIILIKKWVHAAISSNDSR